MDCEKKKKEVQEVSENIPVNSRSAALCLFATGFLSFLSFGFLFGYSSPVIPVFQHMYNATHMSRYGEPISEQTWTLYLTLTMSFLIVGAAIGGITSKFWIMTFSRKHLLQLCHSMLILSNLVMALVGGLTWSWEVMIISRLLSGIPSGIAYSLIPQMIAEMSALNKQAFWQSLAGMGAVLGVLVGSSFAHPKVFGTIQLWPILPAMGTLPVLVYLIVSWWFPEPPMYLLRQGKYDEALKTLKNLREGDEDSCRSELSGMQGETKETEIIGIKKMITTKQYRNQLIAVCSIYANIMLTGANAVLFYADYILREAGVPPETSGSATIGIFGLQFISGVLGIFAIKRFGAWKVSVGANAIIIVAHTLYTISQATIDRAPDVMPIVAVVALAIFVVGWAGGPNLTTLVLLGELSTEPVRPSAFACGSIIMWFTSWLVGFVPPYLQINLGAYSFTIWLGCAIILLIYQVVFLPDPKGKTIEEIQAKFK